MYECRFLFFEMLRYQITITTSTITTFTVTTFTVTTFTGTSSTTSQMNSDSKKV
jgi:hypothetical protein